MMSMCLIVSANPGVEYDRSSHQYMSPNGNHCGNQSVILNDTTVKMAPYSVIWNCSCFVAVFVNIKFQ